MFFNKNFKYKIRPKRRRYTSAKKKSYTVVMSFALCNNCNKTQLGNMTHNPAGRSFLCNKCGHESNYSY